MQRSPALSRSESWGRPAPLARDRRRRHTKIGDVIMMLLQTQLARTLLAHAAGSRPPLIASCGLRPLRLASHARALHSGGNSGSGGSSGPVQRVLSSALRGDFLETTHAMDELTSADVGVHAGGASSTLGGPVCYHHVFSDSSVSIGIFVIPPGGCIPLHDHPGMTVLSKLLFGSLRVTSYDMPAAEPASGPPSVLDALRGFGGGGGSGGGDDRRLLCAPAEVRVVSAPCAPLRLDAVAGNIHAFEALEHTAIFDVLTPPYDSASGRSCHYYEEVLGGTTTTTTGSGGFVELREVPWPDSLNVVNRPYAGEPVARR